MKDPRWPPVAGIVRRLGRAVFVLTLAATTLMGPTHTLAAPTCSVENRGTGTRYETLRSAVDASVDHDVLLVTGTCVGETAIRGTTLRLVGVPTADRPHPTLDGEGVSRVLVVSHARVVIRDLTITDGRARFGGGGVLVWSGRLTLKGSAAVTGNTATVGSGGISNRGTLILGGSAAVTGNTSRYGSGGIHNHYRGTVVLRDTASVAGNDAGRSGGGIDNWGTVVIDGSAAIADNSALDEGGGIYNDGGTVTLTGSSSVTGNEAADGGGIFSGYGGTLTLNDRATVTGNTAAGHGGGIYNDDDGTVTLDGSSSVTGNTAGRRGGGIRSRHGAGRRVYVCSDEVAIGPNDPDDPPDVRWVCPTDDPADLQPRR